MINQEKELAALLADTPLSGREIITLPILEGQETALAVQIMPHEVEAAWRIGKNLLPQTGCWPLATMFGPSWGAPPWREAIVDEDLFSRFYYEEEPDPVDISPQGLCRRADHADYAKAFEQVLHARAEYDLLSERLEYAIESCQSRLGHAPQPEEIAAAKASGKFQHYYGLEHWIAQWETAHGYQTNLEESRLEFFTPENFTALLFLPTTQGWDALAYLNWYGTSDIGSAYYIALGRSWQQRFGAELVAHYGTMLQCEVSRPPQTFEEAWPLACEHDLAGDCTLALPGILLRDYAHGLVGWNRWFLHERP